MTPEVVLALTLKFVGSMAGAALALVFVPPHTIQGFFRRASAALICGMVFASYTRAWVGFDNTGEGRVEAACLTAFVSWWIMGTGVKIIRGFRKEDQETEENQ
jgi:hypothetical protein